MNNFVVITKSYSIFKNIDCNKLVLVKIDIKNSSSENNQLILLINIKSISPVLQ